MRYHNIYELREREYRLNYYKRKSSSLKIEKVDYNFDFNNSKIDLKSNIKVNKKLLFLTDYFIFKKLITDRLLFTFCIIIICDFMFSVKEFILKTINLS